MELYATGLNAFNQLRFSNQETNNEPDDISTFTCVLHDDDAIQCINAAFSYTLVHTASRGLRSAGYIPSDHRPLMSALDSPAAYAHFAQTSAGVLAVNDKNTSAVALPNNASCFKMNELFPPSTVLKQLVAYDAGFAALTADGEVYAWGDERYAACLGRDLTDGVDPASSPGLVTDLLDLPTGPIVKLSAGGYVLAALTAGKDLYVWGHAGRAAVAGLSGLDVTDVPTPVLIEEHDIADMAVGEAHLIVLTMTGEVYVIGSNGNGQLGLGLDVKEAESWTKVSIAGREEGNMIMGVAAGPRNSFLTVQHPIPY